MTDEQILAYVQQLVQQYIRTVRIPELPSYTNYGPLTSGDKFAVWKEVFDKTVHVPLSAILSALGGGGGVRIADVIGFETHDITVAEAGGTTAFIPKVAGVDFYLEIDGRAFKEDEFQILNSGGFNITIPGYQLVAGQRAKLSLYKPQESSGGSSSGGGSYIRGKKQVSTNTTLTSEEYNYVIQIRTNNNQILLTLQDISDIPAHSFLIIETTINNNVEHTINTQSGQNIYINNVSKDKIYIRPGEAVMLYRDTDGWYIISEGFAEIYKNVGRKPEPSFNVGMNEIMCDGQVLERAKYRRLWESVQTLGNSLVDDFTWGISAATDEKGNTVPFPYRGKFSTGDGLTTFRVPDMRGVVLRGLISDIGTDPNRIQNDPGNYQHDLIRSHHHPSGTQPVPGFPDVFNQGASHSFLSWNASTTTSTGSVSTGSTGGDETRMANVGVYWVIKA